MPLTDNEQVNIELVNAVEKYPIIYNFTLKDYSNRNEQDKVWRILAETFQATDAEVKLRWRNLRCAFTRFLRNKSTTGTAVRKPYYLWDHLQFLMPYTKSRTQSDNLGDVSGSSSSLQAITAEDVDDPGLEQSAEELQRTVKKEVEEDIVVQLQPPSTSSTPSSSPSSWRSLKPRKTDPLEKAITRYFENKGKPQQTDPIAAADLNFLSSLLPDVTGLPPKKKRIFKRKVLDLLEELYEDDTSTVYDTSSRATNSETPSSSRPTATLSSTTQPSTDRLPNT